jgi:hypothetical protein
VFKTFAITEAVPGDNSVLEGPGTQLNPRRCFSRARPNNQLFGNARFGRIHVARAIFPRVDSLRSCDCSFKTAIIAAGSMSVTGGPPAKLMPSPCFARMSSPRSPAFAGNSRTIVLAFYFPGCANDRSAPSKAMKKDVQTVMKGSGL